MRYKPVDLKDELAKLPPGPVCLVGGGGKTTLLAALGRAFAGTGQRVLCTTTTRLRRPGPGEPLFFQPSADPAELTFPPGIAVLAAREPRPDEDAGKVYGYDPAALDALWARGGVDQLLVEADGSAGRPVKAPADHEPVIPASAAVVISVLGLTCLNRPLTSEIAFRMERVAAITGLAPGDIVTPRAVAALAAHPRGFFKNTPPNAARVFLCNQADLPGALAAGKALAEILAGLPHLRGLYLAALAKDGLACLTPA